MNQKIEKTKKESKDAIVIDSYDKMNTYLNDLMLTATDCVEEAIKAQLSVVRYIKSPSLVDTTLDTLLLSFKKSLKYADTPKQKDELQEKFSLMIQNYIFFFDARLQYELDCNNKEAWELFESAGEMLSESVQEISMLAITNGLGKAGMKKIVGKIVVKIFLQRESKKKVF